MEKQAIIKNDKIIEPLVIQRTWDATGNLFRHISGKRCKEFRQLNLIERYADVAYVPLEAYEELLEAIQEKREIISVRIIMLDEK